MISRRHTHSLLFLNSPCIMMSRSVLWLGLALVWTSGIVACTASSATAEPAPIQKRAPAAPAAVHADAGASSHKHKLETVYSEPADRPAPLTHKKKISQARLSQQEADEADMVRDIDFEATGAPEGTNEFASQLLAYHTDDIPRGDELRQIDQIETKLLAIEASAGLVIQRQRALALMRDVPSDAIRARLITRAQDQNESVGIRAAALRSLRAVSNINDVDAHKVLHDAMQDANPRIRSAAAPQKHTNQ